MKLIRSTTTVGGLAERVDTLEGSIKELMEEPSSEIISHDEQQPR